MRSIMIIKDKRILFKCPMEEFDDVAHAALMNINREGVVLGEFIEWINYEVMGNGREG